MAKNKDIIELLLFDVLLERVISRIMITVPFFGLPVIKQITIYAISKLLRIVYDEAKLYNAFFKIDQKVDKEVLRFIKAKEKVQKNEKDEKAQEEFKQAARDLIYLGS